jgi:urease accessory protein UreE
MKRHARTRRRRELAAYALGLRHGQAHFELGEMRVSLERELALLRSTVKSLRLDLERARQIDLAVETDRDDEFRRLQ